MNFIFDECLDGAGFFAEELYYLLLGGTIS